MRIFDYKNDKALKDVTLFLKLNEAKELLSSLKDLVSSEDVTRHHHVNDDSYQHEITVTLYDENKLSSFSERSKKIIKEDI